MEPYYDDGQATIYHGDCREVLPRLGLDVRSVFVLTDPPYGVAERTDRKSKGRGNAAECNDFPPVAGDDEPFDPAHLLAFHRLVLFGGNYYADRLPPSSHWLVWDKLAGLATDKRELGFDDNADVELAWTSLPGPSRILSHRWKGMLKDSERADSRLHPTQKPVWLMTRIITAHTEPGELVIDPYMGSGPILRAAKDTGRRAIGMELEERYCEIAAKRLAQEVLDFGVA